MHNLYTVITNLVSVETNSATVNDFLLAQNLTFYPPTHSLPYHYKVLFVPHVPLPQKYHYRIGNYIISGDLIFYDRPLLFRKGFRFVYNSKSKTFYFNDIYKYHYVNIGDIFTVGRLLFHTIEFDLAKDNLFIILGAAVVKNKRTILLLAPNGNGKTTFVNEALNAGYAYLAENYVVLDPKRNLLYGTSPIFHNKHRPANTLLLERFNHNALPVNTEGRIGEGYLVWPKKNVREEALVISNYIDTYSGYYKKNNLVRSLLYYQSGNTLLNTNYSRLITYLQKKIRVIHDWSTISL